MRYTSAAGASPDASASSAGRGTPFRYFGFSRAASIAATYEADRPHKLTR